MTLKYLASASMILLICGVTDCQASVQIVGGSSLLNGTYATQLENWLGQGSLTLTKIFDQTQGDGQNSLDFHSAVDNQGPTFSIIRLRSVNGVPTDQLIGGYNPQSWTSISGYHFTPNLADRTAFLFNLTDSVKQSQTTNSSNGQIQTYNTSSYGPTFGGGHDLYVHGTLDGGYAFNYSYGNTAFSDAITSGGAYYESFNISEIEVFRISPLANGAVPEPMSVAVWGALAGVGGLGLKRRPIQGMASRPAR